MQLSQLLRSSRINSSASQIAPTSPPLTPEDLVAITSVQGWDTFDAAIVAAERWATAAQFCKELRSVTLIRPILSATGDGAAHVRWKPFVGRELGAEFDDNGRFWWVDADQYGVFEMEFATLEQLIDIAKRQVTAAFAKASRKH